MDQNTTPVTSDSKIPVTTPDDKGIVHLDGYVRIFDPNTNEILVEARE